MLWKEMVFLQPSKAALYTSQILRSTISLNGGKLIVASLPTIGSAVLGYFGIQCHTETLHGYMVFTNDNLERSCVCIEATAVRRGPRMRREMTKLPDILRPQVSR